MSIQHVSLADIRGEHLRGLVAESVPESRTLEFKSALQLESDEQKREFLSDLTALANTDGGDLVLGIKAEKGVASEVCGLNGFVADDRIGQIENLLRDAVQPRLSGVRPHVVPLESGAHVLILRVQRSLNAPHMVRHRGIMRFCGRNSNGKYDLDVHELRSAFLASEGIAERLERFRGDRINKLASGTTPVPMSSEHLIVLHLLPVVSVRPEIRFTIPELKLAAKDQQLRPIASSGWGPMCNIDGVIYASSWKNRTYHSYVQLYRNGFLEAADSYTLTANENRIIPSIAWERYLLEVFRGYLKSLNDLKLDPPYAASISLLNVRDYSMHVGPTFSSTGGPINRDHLLTQEILIESLDEEPETVLRPLFDQVWNSCGWEQSINYDKDGNWRGHS